MSTQLADHEAVREALVLLEGDAENEQRLLAWVIAAGNAEPTALRNLLQDACRNT